MQVKTGKGPISMMVVLAIWSLSLAVDLPGLAVTPIEGSLRHIFSDATDFKIQLLTVLPNLVIIPFVLLSGKLSETKHKIAVIVAGTVLYIAAGALSMASSSLTALIWLSCLLGAGCGLILPFSTGLIADVFTGKYRTKQMGIISAIGNIALVLATFVVGFLAAKSWHLPFLVYLLPLVSLLLIPFLKKIPAADLSSATTTDSDNLAPSQKAGKRPVLEIPVADADGFSTKGQTVKGGFYIGRTIWLLLAYFFFVFATSVPAYYLPNLMPEYHMSTEQVSTVTSIFYLAMFVIGLFVTGTMKAFRKGTFILATALILGGLLLFVFTRSMALYVIGSALVGLGNGLAQPIFYTKATEIVVKESKSTLALAYLQVANYVAISMVPVIVNFFEMITGSHTNLFPFIMISVMVAIVLVFVIIRINHFVFGIHKQYYE
ncbi:MAG: MFS transporter [Muribaculaceae bacterium]|nr:MFS transporter [Muribaculaceae bacterium]